MAQRVNDMEEDVRWLADEYVNMVMSEVEEFAPAHPWYSKVLTANEKLARYMDVRPKIVEWLAEVGIAMGYKSWGELLKNLEVVFTGQLFNDMVPLDLQVQVPVALVELVQAGPFDAAKHIREMETLFERRRLASQQLDVAASLPPPTVPLPTTLPVAQTPTPLIQPIQAPTPVSNRQSTGTPATG